MSQSGYFGNTIEYHKQAMAELCGPAANVAILLLLHKHNKWTVILHGIYFAFLTLFTLSTSIPIIQKTGMYDKDKKTKKSNAFIIYLHYCIGIAAMVALAVATVLGLVTKLLNLFKAKSITILFWRKMHRVAGYLILAVVKTNYYVILKGQKFIAFIAQDAIFVIVATLWKVFYPKLVGDSNIQALQSRSGISSTNQVAPVGLKTVNSLQQIDQDKSFVVFSNYVFDIEPLMTTHPAGFQIIKEVSKRDIDRFIYGSHRLDTIPQIPPHSHSANCFNLLGPPLAKIAIPSAFYGFQHTEVPCDIWSLKLISAKANVYQIYLTKKEGFPFEFMKYQSIQQLGRFVSLAANGSVTRLYTAVNFLVEENLTFLHKHLKMETKSMPSYANTMSSLHISSQPNSKLSLSSSRQFSTVQGLQIEIYGSRHQNSCRQDPMPLLFKHYQDGRMSSLLVKGTVKQLVVSQQKGQGLQLGTLSPGKIIIVAGGTGLYPFCDLIDLLYKEQLILEDPSLQKQVISLSPLLQSRPFAKFTFQLFAAFNDPQEIHQCTRAQIAFLAQHGRMPATYRLRQDQDGLIQETTNIRLREERFEELLDEAMEGGQTSRVLICGPTKMNGEIVAFLQKKYNRPELYLLI